MNQTTNTKLLSLFCLLAAVVFYSACLKQPEAKKTDVTGTVGTRVSVETVAREKATKEAALKTSKAPSAALAADALMSEEAHTVYSKKCSQCHGPDGQGIAALGTDLRLAPKRSLDEWEKYLRDPKSIEPKAMKCKPGSLSDEDDKAMSVYLTDLTQHNQTPQKK